MTVDACGGKLIANDVLVLMKKLGAIEAEVEAWIVISDIVLSCTRERKGPNRKAIGEVRGTQSKCPHLSHVTS